MLLHTQKQQCTCMYSHQALNTYTMVANRDNHSEISSVPIAVASSWLMLALKAFRWPTVHPHATDPKRYFQLNITFIRSNFQRKNSNNNNGFHNPFILSSMFPSSMLININY